MRAVVRWCILGLAAILAGFGALTPPAQASGSELGDVVITISTEVHSLQQPAQELLKVLDDAEKSTSSGVPPSMPWAGCVCGRASASLVSGYGLRAVTGLID